MQRPPGFVAAAPVGCRRVEVGVRGLCLESGGRGGGRDAGGGGGGGGAAGAVAVAARPRTAGGAGAGPGGKKLAKNEGLKTASVQLRYPLLEEMATDEIFINEDAVQIMKFHGSYQQDDREARKKGEQKKYQFMLRLKMPAGEFPAGLYQVLDGLSDEAGNGTLRATTRCAWQIHGILKKDLKSVFGAIMNGGGSTVGACGDLSRNVMTTPAPFVSKPYAQARFVSKMLGELFAPQTGAFSEIWLDGEKAASLEYWKDGLDMAEVGRIMREDNGRGVVFPDAEEPIYGETYLPRKFKIGVTVPGDNSIDIYTQDIGIVVISDDAGETVGYNVIVGGGMGRTHRKETTFARTGDHLGFVPADKLWDVCKAIVATQRDHGDRVTRATARMKYLVHKLGIDAFRTLVEEYYGGKIEPYREMAPWKYEDWLGWHEQGDGNLFLGLFVENGRIKDDGQYRIKSALRKAVDTYALDMVVTPNQNVILKNITANQRAGVEALFTEHGVTMADETAANLRLSMACPAMPLCGLAVTEAERHMPSVVARMDALLAAHGASVPVTMRMTGCPNGCARPYMAEIGFVGSGAGRYQLWLGGCPAQTRLAFPVLDKVKDEELEATLGPVIEAWVAERRAADEAFGDFCARQGKDALATLILDGGGAGTVSTGPIPKEDKARAPPRVTIVDAPAAASPAAAAPAAAPAAPAPTPMASTPTAAKANAKAKKPAKAGLGKAKKARKHAPQGAAHKAKSPAAAGDAVGSQVVEPSCPQRGGQPTVASAVPDVDKFASVAAPRTSPSPPCLEHESPAKKQRAAKLGGDDASASGGPGRDASADRRERTKSAEAPRFSPTTPAHAGLSPSEGDRTRKPPGGAGAGDSPRRASSPTALMTQHKRNVLSWDALFESRYPPAFHTFERALRVVARQYLDSNGSVKPLPTAEVSAELDRALDRYRVCADAFPGADAEDRRVFEDYVVGTECSLDAIRALVQASPEADVDVGIGVALTRRRSTYSNRERSAAILRTCVRVSDMKPLDSELVRQLLDHEDSEIDAAIFREFNNLFGVAKRFTPSPRSSWVINYRHLRDAYAFAIFFSQEYFTREGLVSCVLGQVPESDIVHAHERCVKAFPKSALSPVKLDHCSWTRLSDVEFARKVFRSTTGPALGRALGLAASPPDADLSGEWTPNLLKRLEDMGATLDDVTEAARYVRSRMLRLRIWTRAGALLAVARALKQADANACLPTTAAQALDGAEELCARFAVPRPIAATEEWTGLRNRAFTERLFDIYTTDELASFFRVQRVGSGMRDLLKRGTASLEEAHALLSKESDEWASTAPGLGIKKQT